MYSLQYSQIEYSTGYSPSTRTYGGAYSFSTSQVVPQHYHIDPVSVLTFSKDESVHFEPDSFLNPLRPETETVHDESVIMDYVREAFQAVFNSPFPSNIQLTVCSDAHFKSEHAKTGSVWSDGIVGFSLNTQGKGINKIFVRQDKLDRVLLTIGHEIGHVLTPSLVDGRDEEAKAYSFSLAWMDVIRERNIAGIADCLLPRPAVNGLHDVAFDFTMKLLNQGKKAMDVFKDIVYGVVTFGGFYG